MAARGRSSHRYASDFRADRSKLELGNGGLCADFDDVIHRAEGVGMAIVAAVEGGVLAAVGEVPGAIHYEFELIAAGRQRDGYSPEAVGAFLQRRCIVAPAVEIGGEKDRPGERRRAPKDGGRVAWE